MQKFEDGWRLEVRKFSCFMPFGIFCRMAWMTQTSQKRNCWKLRASAGRTLASPCWSAFQKQRHSTIRCERKHHQPNKYKLPLQNFNKKFVKTSWLLQMIFLPNDSYSSEASPEVIGVEPIGGPLGLLHRLCSRLPQPKHPHLRPDGASGLSIFCFNSIKSF